VVVRPSLSKFVTAHQFSVAPTTFRGRQFSAWQGRSRGREVALSRGCFAAFSLLREEQFGPAPSVTVVRVATERAFLRMTSAPGTTACCGSLTTRLCRWPHRGNRGWLAFCGVELFQQRRWVKSRQSATLDIPW